MMPKPHITRRERRVGDRLLQEERDETGRIVATHWRERQTPPALVVEVVVEDRATGLPLRTHAIPAAWPLTDESLEFLPLRGATIRLPVCLEGHTALRVTATISPFDCHVTAVRLIVRHRIDNCLTVGARPPGNIGSNTNPIRIDATVEVDHA